MSSWTLPLVTVVPAAVAGVVIVRMTRAGLSRRAALVAVSLVAWVLVTSSFLEVYDHTLFWVLAVQDVLLLTLVPIPFVLAVSTRWPLPPVVGSVAAVATLTAVYVTGWDQARLEHQALFAATQVLLVAVGCLFLGPLLDEHRGAFAGRAFVAFLDGLLDAIPGLVVLGTHGLIAGHWYLTHRRSWGPSNVADQRLGGTAMIALSELVGLPAVVLLVVRWIRSDAREAALVDARLDSAELAEPGTDRPWWERDPGPLADRAHRYDGSP